MTFKKGIWIFALIGLILGVILDLLIRYQNTTLFYYSFATLFGLLYALAYDEKNLIRLIGSSFIISLILSIPMLTVKLNIEPRHYLHVLTFLVAFPFFVYVGHAFHYALHRDNTLPVTYNSLFEAVWNTLPLIFIAFLFSSLANLLIMMGAFIFKTVNSLFLWNLYFYNHHFNLITNTILFFIGLGIAQQNINIIYNLRFLLLRIIYYLFPFLALISVLYFILYALHSLSGGIQYIDPLLLLVPLTILGIIFFNAYFQDGKTESNYPEWLKTSLKGYRVILFILAVIMVYKVLNQYSIEINSLIYLLVALLFTLTYAITALLPESKEKHWVKIGNVGTAMFFMFALFFLNLPYLNIDYTVGKTGAAVIPWAY